MNIMQPGEMPNQPPGYCQGTLGSGICTGMNYQYGAAFIVNDPGNCHSGSWCIRADLTAGAVIPNTTNFDIGYSGGNRALGCNTVYSGAGDPAQCAANRHFFYHWWQKWSPNFILNPAGTVAVCQGKIQYFRGYNTSINTLDLRFRTYGGSNTYSLTFEDGYIPDSQQFSFTADGQWHEFEVEYDVPHQNVNAWMDGIQVVSNLHTQLDPNTIIGNNKPGMYINNNPGSDACSSANNSSFWVDDIAVSTQRIGGGAAAPKVPGPPSGITLTQLLVPWAQDAQRVAPTPR
jgi:hypothetical protein